MDRTFTPGLLNGLPHVPWIEPSSKTASNGLRDLGAVIVPEAQVGQAKLLREHPTLAVVLVAEGGDADVAIPTLIGDLSIEVAESGESQNCVAEFGVLLPVDSPEALRVHLPYYVGLAHRLSGVPAILQQPPEIFVRKVESYSRNRIHFAKEPKSLRTRDRPKSTPGSILRGLGG
jgi:hypothetical protein